MKISTIAAFFALASFCSAVNAATPVNVAVYATEKSNGSMSVGGKNAYTKTFDIVVANLSGKDIDLSKLCLKAYSPDNKEFTLDTVDEVLTKGTLKEGKSVKSFATFASENDAVYKAALIKISDNCK
ncbi:DUF4354 family protein [Yersinia enterocolitica]|uniref:DUF4354 family protein n=1 Tax=Yersinia enterocolitica TaxID=630 RepID=UPI001C8D25AC|nr:DUF4354 family protein [Yersinia enterocolitica]MBX9490095.1 DUF4354 family protein [Yersinia enterocolitica]MBX9494380.1 DUF4354 family protein [Yersinia enterocolitica]HEN3636759.1 DUF4354 family protein [Yersinia enterocolitica]